ncbi:DUF6221 family protein [Kitasatospora sp. NPDC127116]|uniref:DUF6221 family protein n=1 Tax=Kitasatospora sp. NPDC127116 TaxID=3345367 RepID=UPI0036349B63
MTADLLQFLRARLDEDERLAQAATPGPWRHDATKHWHQPGTCQFEEAVFAGAPGSAAICVAGTGDSDDPQSMADADHIARHDPARVLAEVDAKRQLLGPGGPFCTSECDRPDNQPMDPDTGWTTPLEHHFDCGIHRAAEILAAPYADHPDYRPVWAPSA